MSARFRAHHAGGQPRRTAIDTSRAVIQTYSPLHPVILTAARQDYSTRRSVRRAKCRRAKRFGARPCDITMITAVGELDKRCSAVCSLKTRLQSLMEGSLPMKGVLGPAAAQMVKGDGTVSLPPHHSREGL